MYSNTYHENSVIVHLKTHREGRSIKEICEIDSDDGKEHMLQKMQRSQGRIHVDMSEKQKDS